MATKKKPTREEFAAGMKKELAKVEEATKKVEEEVSAKAKEVKLDATVKAKEAEEKAKPKVKAATEKAKTAAKATTAKAKTTVKKTKEKAAAKVVEKKSEVKETAVLQFMGRDFAVEDIITRAKEAYKEENKNNTLKEIRVYIKPEDNAAYYVANDTYAGRIDL